PDSGYHGLRYAHDLGDLSPLAFILRMRLVPLRNLGACIAPDNAWLFLQGIETLHLRMQRHCENALKVAQALAKHPAVEWVRYPGLETDATYPVAERYLKKGFGAMVVFGITGGAEAGKRFIEHLNLFSHLANVGDAKSLAIHPATTTHSQLSPDDQIAAGIAPELVRLAIGIEDIEDIMMDLQQALKHATT
ncbi:MAG TPA: PLP-dependent transferase, partial [Candidatus Obscuribacterales bacterium]